MTASAPFGCHASLELASRAIAQAEIKCTLHKQPGLALGAGASCACRIIVWTNITAAATVVIVRAEINASTTTAGGLARIRRYAASGAAISAVAFII
jgi:hypothetical protein